MASDFHPDECWWLLRAVIVEVIVLLILPHIKGQTATTNSPPPPTPSPSPLTPPPRLHPHTFLRGEGVFFFYNSDLIEFQFTEYVDNHICVLSLQSSMETCSRVPAETRCAANKGHSPVSPSEEFYLEFLCATEL